MAYGFGEREKLPWWAKYLHGWEQAAVPWQKNGLYFEEYYIFYLGNAEDKFRWVERGILVYAFIRSICFSWRERRHLSEYLTELPDLILIMLKKGSNYDYDINNG